MVMSLFRVIFICSFVLFLVGCQMPVDGSSGNLNADESNTNAPQINEYIVEIEYQNISNIDDLLFSDEKTNEITEITEITEVIEADEREAIHNIVVDTEVINNLPIVLGESVVIDEDSSFYLAGLLENDIDEDGDILSISDFTQGSEGGFIERFEGNVLRYTPKPNFNGNEYFMYNVSDGNGAKVEGKVSINVKSINDLPVAQSDSFILNQSQTEIINILENDEGVGDGVQISVISQAENGVVSVMDNGFVSYTPNIAYFGKDEFVYKIVDENGDSSIASVRLQIDCENNCTSVFELNWDESKSVDVIGYNVYVGRSADKLDSVFKLGNEMRFAYLAENKGEYYFAVSAINGEGVESELTPTVLGVF